MQRKPLALPLLVGAALIGATAIPAPTVRSCRLQVVPDYTLGVTYRASLRLAPECPPGTVLRVRKSSTTSTRQGGAPYQPIKPLKGAWDVGILAKSPVPREELWTLYSWRWEYSLSSAPQRWRAGEVLRAAP